MFTEYLTWGLTITEPIFDNQRDGKRACGNRWMTAGQPGSFAAPSSPRAAAGGQPGRLGFPDCRGVSRRGAAGAAGAARAAAAGRAGSRVGGGRGGVRPAVPGAGGRRVGGRGVVRDRRDTRGRGARGRGPRPGRRADPAGPGSRPGLAAGGGVAARRRASSSCCARPGERRPRSGSASRRRCGAGGGCCWWPGTGPGRRCGCGSSPSGGPGSVTGTGGCGRAARRWWRTAAGRRP